MALKLLRFLLRKAGYRYPAGFVVLQFQLAHFLLIPAAVGLLSLYEDMNAAQFWRLLLFAEGLVLIENVFRFILARRLLRPVEEWLKGDRSSTNTVAAWRSAADMPTIFMKKWRWYTLLFTLFPFTLYARAELDMPLYSVPILMASGAVIILYGAVVRFFAFETAMLPILERVALELPSDFDPNYRGFTLRWKLFGLLPAMTVITGFTVSGLSNPDGADIQALGIDVLLALAVAFTISLELTVLMVRSLMVPLGNLQKATERVASGDLQVRVPVLSGDETGQLAQSFNRMVLGLEERNRLHEAFAAYVAPEISEQVLQGDTQVDGSEADVSVLFIDIRGFTAMAERLDAHQLVSLLNDFYSNVVPILNKHGGHANKFIGDGLLGVFGAPERLEDHADRALASALEIARVVRLAYGDALRIGIGVNSGPVIASTIGGGGKLEFTVIGDTVNTASKVEELTRQTGDDILLTEDTKNLLKRDFGVLEERPNVELKGKRERVRIYAPESLSPPLPAGSQVFGE